jgi:hypothetical protein
MISEASIQRLAILYPVLRELPVSLIRTIQETSYELVAPAGQILFDLGAGGIIFIQDREALVQTLQTACN